MHSGLLYSSLAGGCALSHILQVFGNEYYRHIHVYVGVCTVLVSMIKIQLKVCIVSDQQQCVHCLTLLWVFINSGMVVFSTDFHIISSILAKKKQLYLSLQQSLPSPPICVPFSLLFLHIFFFRSLYFLTSLSERRCKQYDIRLCFCKRIENKINQLIVYCRRLKSHAIYHFIRCHDCQFSTTPAASRSLPHFMVCALSFSFVGFCFFEVAVRRVLLLSLFHQFLSICVTIKALLCTCTLHQKFAMVFNRSFLLYFIILFFYSQVSSTN